jgi:hypothetical protein
MNWKPQDKVGDEPGMSCRTLGQCLTNLGNVTIDRRQISDRRTRRSSRRSSERRFCYKVEPCAADNAERPEKKNWHGSIGFRSRLSRTRR